MEVFPLKFGNPILSSAVVMSSAVILKFYRNRMKLKNYGRFTLFLPVVLIPSLFNQLYQNTTTTKSIILQDDCPACITTQSMAIQLGTGILYPLMGTIGGTYMFAHKMGTVVLASNGFDLVKEFATHLMKTSRPIYNRLTVFVIGHVLLSYTITYYQMENLEFLRLKMLEQEKEDIKRLQETQQIRNKSPSN